MFKHKRQILLLLFLLLGGFTWLCADHFVPDKTRTFWYLLGGIWTGELLLAANVVFIPNSNGRSMPFRLGELSVNILYLLFTVSMIMPFGDKSLSPGGFLLWELGGFFVALTLHCLFGFARSDAHGVEANTAQTLTVRESLRNNLERIRFAKKHLCVGNSDVDAAFDELMEDARSLLNFKAISAYDHELRLAQIEIQNADSPDKIILAVDKLRDLLRLIKKSRTDSGQ